MQNKNNLYLLGLVLVILFGFGCSCGLINALQQPGTTTTTNTNTASPTPSATPSLSEKIYEFEKNKEDLGKFTAPVKLDPKAKVQGKVAIIEGEDNYYALQGIKYSDFDEEGLKDYGLTKDDMALKTDEIDTLVQTNCKKGKKIGSYKVTDGRIIPAYALNCETLVFNYKTPAVFAKKSFYSSDLSDNIEVSSTTTERTAYRPTEQIQKFIKSLRGK